MGANWNCMKSPGESLDKQTFAGKWAVCSGEQTLIFNTFICRNFLKQLVELFFALQSYLSLEKFFWNKELCDVDIGGLQMCLNHADTDGLNSHLPKPGPTKMFPA